MIADLQFFQEFISRIETIRNGGSAEPGWRVYANTGLRAYIDALRANFPSVLRLIGDPAFSQLAREYAMSMPTRDARLFLYGAELPTWLRQRYPDRHKIVLAATLDRYWTEIHSEVDAQPLTMPWIAAQGTHTIASLFLRTAPSTRWLACRDFPLWDWWQTLQPDPQMDLPPLGGANQCVLLTRPDDAIWAQALPYAGTVLLQACEDGLSLQQALLSASDSAPDTDLQQLLATLFDAGAFQHPNHYTPRAF